MDAVELRFREEQNSIAYTQHKDSKTVKALAWSILGVLVFAVVPLLGFIAVRRSQDER